MLLALDNHKVNLRDKPKASPPRPTLQMASIRVATLLLVLLLAASTPKAPLQAASPRLALTLQVLTKTDIILGTLLLAIHLVMSLLEPLPVSTQAVSIRELLEVNKPRDIPQAARLVGLLELLPASTQAASTPEHLQVNNPRVTLQMVSLLELLPASTLEPLLVANNLRDTPQAARLPDLLKLLPASTQAASTPERLQVNNLRVTLQVVSI